MNDFFKQLTDAVRTIGGENLIPDSDQLIQTADTIRKEAAKFLDSREKKKVWSGAEHIASGSAPDTIIPGCIVLEGGSFRGVYTSGVLDVLMENGINLQSVIGTSAGALNGFNYVAGEIGRAAKINLLYRHDGRYFGARSAAKSRGVVGFNFILDEIEDEIPFNWERFNDPRRRFVATATVCDTGSGIYLEKGIFPDMTQAIRASASMPLVSEPVDINGVECLDGGLVWKVPYEWALNNGFEKILVIRTRPVWFRRGDNNAAFRELVEGVYSGQPALRDRLLGQKEIYNTECDELEELERQGRVLQICPSGSIEVSTLEGDMEKLGALYLLGRRDAQCELPRIREYLGI